LRRFIFIHMPWTAIMAAITIQSSFSSITLPPIGIHFSDKFLHFVVFGILGWFLARGLYHSKNEFIKKQFVIVSCIIGFIFAFSDEWHQSFVPGRSSEFLDWTADCLGILVSSLLYSRFVKLRLQQKSS